MRYGFLMLLGVLMTGCAEGRVDPDTIGIGPIPDASSTANPNTAAVVQADKAELDCLLQEVQIALAQAPDSGKVSFNGLKVCRIVP
ncbi:MAG: hypothetical protein AAF479_15505 [Pseudomonadota bacterium]